MKNFITLGFAVLLLGACQSSSSSDKQTAGQSSDTTANKVISNSLLNPALPVQIIDVQQAIEKSKVLMNDYKSIVEQMNALPESAKTEHKEIFDAMINYANEVLKNQPVNHANLESLAAGGKIENQDNARNLILQTEEYARHVSGYESRIQLLKTPGAANGRR